MTIFFTSDHHFDHFNIIRMCNRPYSSLEEMNEDLIQKWNSVVQYDDEVWHLGDWCFGNQQQKGKYWASRLNGRKHFIWGNHDKHWVRDGDWWESSQPYKELVFQSNGKTYRVVLFHYALKVWNGSYRDKNCYQLFGHSHGKLPGNKQQVDVGVDYPFWNYTPVTIEQITEHLKILAERKVDG